MGCGDFVCVFKHQIASGAAGSVLNFHLPASKTKAMYNFCAFFPSDRQIIHWLLCLFATLCETLQKAIDHLMANSKSELSMLAGVVSSA